MFDLVRWNAIERVYTLRVAPTPAVRDLCAMAPAIYADTQRRLAPHKPAVLTAELSKLVLHYPTRRFTEEQFETWADGYHQVLAAYPDELLVHVCGEWLATVPDRMPTPAALKQQCETAHAVAKIRAEYVAQALPALELWDRETKPKGAAHG